MVTLFYGLYSSLTFIWAVGKPGSICWTEFQTVGLDWSCRRRQGRVSIQGQGVSDTQPVGRTGDLAVWRRPERRHNPTPGWPSILLSQSWPRDTNAMFCQVKPELSSTKQCLDGPSYLHWTRNLSSLFLRDWADTTNSQMFENKSSLRKTFCKAWRQNK